MKLSAEQKAYLDKKHEGGVSNQKGNTFENIYATYQIVRLFAQSADLLHTYVACQIKDAFVDDFLILEDNGYKIYHQIKNKKGLSWGKMQKRQLLYDFSHQRCYSLENKEIFSLKIVYSDDDCKLHKNAIPELISDVTIKEFFVDYTTLSALLLQSKDLQKWLISIMNYPGYVFPLDEQSAFLELIRSQWLELATPDKLVSLAEIKNTYTRKHPGCPNFKETPSVILPEDFVKIVNTIPDFEYAISGELMYWKCKRTNGEQLITEEWLSKVIAAMPKSFMELFTLFD